MPYFKKVNPKQALYIADGTPVKFEAVDNQTGIYPPEGKGMSDGLANQFRDAIKAERGGVTEINDQEYRSLVEKKNTVPLKKVWREEFSLGNPLQGETAGSSLKPHNPFRQPGSVAAGDVPVMPPVTSELPKAIKK